MKKKMVCLDFSEIVNALEDNANGRNYLVVSPKG